MDITEQLLAYIIHHLSGKITKTQLVKLMYLADLKSVEFTGNQITNIDWIYHHFGPYDKKLDEKLSLLKKKGIIDISPKTKAIKSGDKYFIYSYIGPKNIGLELDSTRQQIINTILEQYGSFTLHALLDYVYNTPPMTGAKKGKSLDLHKIVSVDVKRKES